MTTDFGTRDGYVGAMKGVILSRCPSAAVVDIAHDLPAGDVAAAAWTVRGACPHFPPGTIHVVVIDPGVGTDRPLLAGQFGGQTYLAPDNGVLTLVAQERPTGPCVRITNRRHFRAAISRTFHGRDILAPCAAAVASGAALSALGPQAQPTALLNFTPPRREETGRIIGEVLATDRFGNLITNVPAAWLADLPAWRLKLGPMVIERLSEAYGHAPAGEALAIIGSFDLLELALNGGSLADHLGAGPGTGFEIVVSG